MGSPKLLTAVAGYYLAIHDATTINDIGTRTKAMRAAQWAFEEACDEFAASKPA
jgi:hypothetical protein